MPGRMFSGEELGKKYDGHPPAASDGTTLVSTLVRNGWSPVSRVRRRRLAAVALACLLLYLFFSRMHTDLNPALGQADGRVPRQTSNGLPLSTHLQSGKPPLSSKTPKTEKHYFNGPINFNALSASLLAISRTMGYRADNKNVLFAAASLGSASRLIPMACEMSRWNRNVVHFALTGREDILLRDLRDINGAGDECEVYWHDARPDFAEWSTDYRMESSVAACMGDFQAFMHPQVVITDDPDEEEAFFVKGMRLASHHLKKTLIQLPPDAVQSLMWITRLDVGSLKAWHNTYVDILIQAPRYGSGPLVRLLKSIENADYFGARRPHLTVELPADIDEATWSFLQNFNWPPLDPSGTPHTSQLSLRHRIHHAKMTPEEASTRFVESFYPTQPRNSHVLVLSPQVELSGLYYQYLFYNLLEYKHSFYGSKVEAQRLAGLSLNLPTYTLGGQSFEPPTVVDPVARKETVTSFLWQSPNSNAALYFGDKWMELHSFLSARVASHQSHPIARQKSISQTYPAWTEYLLELMRARGYSLLYPNLPSSESFATVHSELFEAPEEFLTPNSETPAGDDYPSQPETFTHEIPPFPLPKHLERPLTAASLIHLLPHAGDLPELYSLPLLSHAGTAVTANAAINAAEAFTEDFRTRIGGCASDSEHVLQSRRADDLFCWGDPPEKEKPAWPDLGFLESQTRANPRDPTADGNGDREPARPAMEMPAVGGARARDAFRHSAILWNTAEETAEEREVRMLHEAVVEEERQAEFQKHLERQSKK